MTSCVPSSSDERFATLPSSGQLKSLLNPFAAVSEEADAKAKLLVSQIGAAFLDEVKRARSATLKANVDYGSGEIWGGQEAKDIGLVDGISTLDEVVATTCGLPEPRHIRPVLRDP